MKKIAIIEEIDKEGLKLFENNPNFKNIVNSVINIPLIVTTFLTLSEVLMVIVQNNNTRAVPTKANVGPITIQLRPIICETVFNLNLR